MIFTERTITIRNDSSSMNAPVVLYRGDKNVEVRFTLVESPYKYSNRDSINIIESTNASYAQLVIKTPNDRDPIFGDITAVGKSNVVFIIGYDMIDEIEEVGTYSFQIRLFDADQTSMVTIPEVVGGFIIREPIAKEDTNNNITNSAIVGSAVVTNDLEIPTFVGGSYNKSAWYDGVVISRQKLDKIEDGIYETYELSKVNNSQIKEIENKKRDRTETIKSYELDKTSDANKIHYDNLAEDVIKKLVPNGNITIDGTIKNLSMINEKYALNSIKATEINFINETNMINPSEIVNGYYINSNTGVATGNSKYSITNYIKVNPGEKLAKFNVVSIFFAFYDKDLNFVSYGASELDDVFIVPNDAYFLRLSINRENPTLVRSDVSMTKYIPYELIFSDDVNILKSIKSKSITNDLLNDFVCKIQHGKNLFNKNTATIDSYISNSGSIISSSGWYISDYIPVDSGKTIALSYGHNVNEYDIYGNLIKTTNNSKIITLTDETTSIRFSCYSKWYSMDDFQVEYGDTNTSYEDFCYKIINNIDGVPIIINDEKSIYENKVITTFGDSTVAQNQWQPHVVKALKFGTHINKGIGGTRISGTYEYHKAMWTDERLADLPEQTDVFCLLGGINDWAQNVPLGEIDSLDTDTFYGALNVLLPKLTEKYPTSLILIMSTTWAHAPNRDAFENKEGLINNKGLLAIDYGEAMIKCAKRHGLAYVDLSGCGWNQYNYTNYMMDTLHFSLDTGGKIVANHVIDKLKIYNNV